MTAVNHNNKIILFINKQQNILAKEQNSVVCMYISTDITQQNIFCQS